MLNVSPITPSYNSKVNFKANKNQNVYYQPYTMDQQYRKQNKQPWWKKYSFAQILGIASSLVILSYFGLALKREVFSKNAYDSIRSNTEKEALKLKAVDLTKIKERAKDSYSKEVQDFITRLDGLLKRADIEEKAGKRTTQVQLAGPGGTGKTDVAGVIAKKVNELFPGSEYYIPDLSMLSSSSYSGQDVQMITEYTNAVLKRIEQLEAESAQTGKKKYVIMFLDEYDKIAMEDFSFSKHNSNAKIGALKTLINGLMGHDNVLLLSATNYPELIEGAVGSRVADKVLVDFLNPLQIRTAIAEHYKDAKLGRIADELLDPANKKLSEFSDILGKPEHEMEYRKLFNNLLPNALIKSPEDGKIELKHLVEAATSPSIARELHLTAEEIEQLQNIVKA